MNASHPMDALACAPEHHRLLFENEHVRVLDTRIGPGERSRLLAHEWPASLYVVSWSDFIRYDEHGAPVLDSRMLPQRPPAGSALWTGPLGPHALENIGDAPLHIVAVEMKGAR